MNEIIASNIIEDMTLCRLICSLGNKLRHDNNIPNRMPLLALQFEGQFLWRDYLELIEKDVNVKDVNPYFCCRNEGDKWVETEKNGVRVALQIDTDEFWQHEQYNKIKERRDAIMKHKQYE